MYVHIYVYTHVCVCMYIRICVLYIRTCILYVMYISSMCRGQKLKGAEGGLQQDPSSTNPFSHRPVSALGGKKPGSNLLSELDHPSNMPEGVERAVWDRLVQARRRKYESELKVKTHPLYMCMHCNVDKLTKHTSSRNCTYVHTCMDVLKHTYMHASMQRCL